MVANRFIYEVIGDTTTEHTNKAVALRMAYKKAKEMPERNVYVYKYERIPSRQFPGMYDIGNYLLAYTVAYRTYHNRVLITSEFNRKHYKNDPDKWVKILKSDGTAGMSFKEFLRSRGM